MSGFWSFFWGFVYFLLLFGSILFLAYISTKFLGSKISGKMRGKHFRIVDSLTLGFDKQIYLIKIGEQLYITACSNKTINLMIPVENDKMKLSDEDLESIENPTLGKENLFNNYLQAFKDSFMKEKGENKEKVVETQNKRFDQNLSKLKGILSKINSHENGDEKLNE